MTFEDDFVQLDLLTGPRRLVLKSLGLSWPPPARLQFMGFWFQRVSMSEISDEDRARMTRVCRGAAYDSEAHPPPASVVREVIAQ